MKESIKKVVLLLLFMVGVSISQTTQSVWKYQDRYNTRPGWNDTTGFYHITGSDTVTSIQFGLPDNFDGLLVVDYIYTDSLPGVSFQILISSGVGFIPIDMTFSTITNENGDTVYRWISDPQSNDFIQNAPFYRFKIRMIKSTTIDAYIKMTWNSY